MADATLEGIRAGGVEWRELLQRELFSRAKKESQRKPYLKKLKEHREAVQLAHARDNHHVVRPRA